MNGIGDYTMEEVGMFADPTDLSWWDDPAYTLQVEELMNFAEILNRLSGVCGLATWFSTTPGMADEVAIALQNTQVCALFIFYIQWCLYPESIDVKESGCPSCVEFRDPNSPPRFFFIFK